MALLANTEYVAVFDDDTIPGENWLRNCLETMEISPGILGTAGVRLQSSNYGERSMHGWQTPENKIREVDLVGQAWFLRTEWLRHLFAEPPILGTNGEDIEFAARCWRFAGIRSFCPAHPPEDQSRWGSLRGMELGIDQVAASLQASHQSDRDRIVKAEIAAGWRPLFRRAVPDANETLIASTRHFPTKSSGARSSPLDHSGEPEVQVSRKLSDVKFPLQGSSLIASSRADERDYQVTERADRGTRNDHFGQTKVSGLFDLVPPQATRVLVISPSGHETRSGLASRTNATITVLAPESLLENPPSDGNSAQRVSKNEAPFDCVLCDETLSIVKDPSALLRQARSQLSPDGRLLISVPNARHIKTINALMRGDWTHDCRQPRLRFFTRREAEKLLFRCGFDLRQRIPLGDAAYQAWQNQGCSAEVSLENLTIGCTSP